MKDSGSDGETQAESVMLDTQEETSEVAVRKFLSDQANSKMKMNDDHTSQKTSVTLQGLAISKDSTVQFPVMTIVHPSNESFYG